MECFRRNELRRGRGNPSVEASNINSLGVGAEGGRGS